LYQLPTPILLLFYSGNTTGGLSKSFEQHMEGKVLESAANVLIIPSIRARPSSIQNTSVLPMTTVGDANAHGNENQLPNKRQRVDIIAATCLYWPESPEAYLQEGVTM
jgi:hypothetical protein